MIMIAVGILLGLILCLLFGIPYIEFLKKHMFGQYVKDVAPEAHAKKQGTPTTGGIFIVLAIILGSLVTLLLEQKLTTAALIILITLFFYCMAGFQDDFLKIKGKANDGLSAKGKLFRQIGIALLPAFFMFLTKGSTIYFGAYHFDLGWFFPIFAVLVITGASNAYNLTDGLDGLASATGVGAFVACTAIAMISGNTEVAIISAVTIGALIGFLRYNKPKAQVFMGDTGSLAIGGLLGTLGVMGKFEIWLIFLGIIFVMETLSVMIQVTSYKLTKKRVFKMAPIHHHFELCGWSEKKIVAIFTLISFLFAILTIISFAISYEGV